MQKFLAKSRTENFYFLVLVILVLRNVKTKKAFTLVYKRISVLSYKSIDLMTFFGRKDPWIVALATLSCRPPDFGTFDMNQLNICFFVPWLITLDVNKLSTLITMVVMLRYGFLFNSLSKNQSSSQKHFWQILYQKWNPNSNHGSP